MRYAVIIPVYNEVRLLSACVERLLATPPPPTRPGGAERCERLIVLVDDGSTDGSAKLVKELGERHQLITILHPRNKGKGAAIRDGLAAALAHDAQLFLIHDADLEYDPVDHDAVLRPILDGKADAVVGSRFLGQAHRVLYFWHWAANRFITLLFDMSVNLNLTDVECCSKAFTREVAEKLRLQEDRFGIEIELVAKIARLRLPAGERAPAPGARLPARIFEVPVSYAGRTYAEGKKITWKDGVAALSCIFRYGVTRTQ